MQLSTRATFTVLLRPPVARPGRSRRWCAHCLDFDLGVAATTKPAVKLRLATTVAARISLGSRLPPPKPVDDRALWDVALSAPLVGCQTVETEMGPVEIRYVQPDEAALEARA